MEGNSGNGRKGGIQARMTPGERQALFDEYLQLRQESDKIRTPKPAHLPFGTAWTTAESASLHRRMEGIRNIIQYEALRELYIYIDERLK